MTVTVDSEDLHEVIDRIVWQIFEAGKRDYRGSANELREELHKHVCAALQQPAAPDLSEALKETREALHSLLLVVTFGAGDRESRIDKAHEIWHKHSPHPRVHTAVDKLVAGVIAATEQPAIRTQQSMWTATLPATPKPSSVSADYVTEEQARKAFHADDIRTQLLTFVPKVSEWPEGANYFAFDGDNSGVGWFYIDGPETYSTGAVWKIATSRAGLRSNVILPNELRQHWQQSLFSRAEVLAERGE